MLDWIEEYSWQNYLGRVRNLTSHNCLNIFFKCLILNSYQSPNVLNMDWEYSLVVQCMCMYVFNVWYVKSRISLYISSLQYRYISGLADAAFLWQELLSLSYCHIIIAPCAGLKWHVPFKRTQQCYKYHSISQEVLFSERGQFFLHCIYNMWQ